MCYTISPYEFPQRDAFCVGIAEGTECCTKASFFVFIYMRGLLGDAPLVSTSIKLLHYFFRYLNEVAVWLGPMTVNQHTAVFAYLCAQGLDCLYYTRRGR